MPMLRIIYVKTVISIGSGLRILSKQDLANLKLIAEKDPKMFAQLMALTTLAENEAESK